MARIYVDDVTVGEDALEVVFQVRIEGPLTEPVSISYDTDGGTAVRRPSGDPDFVRTQGVLVIEPEQTTATITVPLLPDDRIEPTEQFFLRLSSSSPQAALAQSRAIATIVNDDISSAAPPRPPVASISDIVVDEATHAARFVITLDRPSDGSVVLQYRTRDGAALAGEDYVRTVGSLEFAAGEVTHTVEVPLLQGDSLEDSETFHLDLHDGVNVTVLDPTGSAVIYQNNFAPVNRVGISVGDVVVGEHATYAEFLVTLDRPATSEVRVDYASSSGTARPPLNGGDDYAQTIGELIFVPGETIKTVRVPITDNVVVEGTESLYLSLLRPSDGAFVARPIATATIIDNDRITGTPAVSVADVYVDEAAGVVRFTVTLDRPSTENIVLNYRTVDDTALSSGAAADYVSQSGRIAFAAGQTAQEVVIALRDDTDDENPERFRLSLSRRDGDVVVQDPTAHAVIFDNDTVVPTPPAVVGIVLPTLAGESEGFAQAYVVLGAASDVPVSVRYSVVNSSTNNSDHAAASGTVTFAPGQTVQSVRIPIVDDSLLEPLELLTLRIDRPSGVLIEPGSSTALLGIIDNEGGLQVLREGLSDDVYELSGTSSVILDAGGVDEVRIAGHYSLVQTIGDPTTVQLTLEDSVENLRLLGTGNFNGTGNSLANTITGNAGRNTLIGAAGNDRLSGLGGIDRLEGGDGSDRLDGGAGNDTLLGGAGIDTLLGGAGNDSLDGGTGRDSMTGGSGNDTYRVDNTGDRTTESGTSPVEIDTVISSVTWNLGPNLEHLTLAGTRAINGTGNALANTVMGNGAANVLDGQTGNDRLDGKAGNDSLRGGAGNDTLIGGAGNDLLDGGTGRDDMNGGAGNDTYRVDHTGDRITEAGTSLREIDTVVSTVTWQLGNTLEHLTLAGTRAINGTGNNLANTLTGNGAANVLNGGGGNDTLRGGAGNDTLLGGSGNDVLYGGAGRDELTAGAGNDTFVFDTRPGSTNVDTITDFNASGDRIRLDEDVFTRLGNDPGERLSASEFVVGTKATTASHRVVYNDTTGALYYDADGSGAGAAVRIADLDRKLTGLGNDDFFVG